MRVKDIVIGETSYKKDTKFYAKVLKVLPPHTDENYNSYAVCKVEYSPPSNLWHGFLGIH